MSGRGVLFLEASVPGHPEHPIPKPIALNEYLNT
jgi:hypothetical protein